MVSLRSAGCLYVILVLVVSMPVALAQSTNGLIAHYPFSGDANDASGNSNNGTVYGATLTTDRFGNANSAYSFNGTSDYILTPSNNLLDSHHSGTVSYWFQCENLGSSPTALAYSTDGSPYSLYSFGVDRGRIFVIYKHPTLGYNPAVIGSTTLISGHWYHVAVVADGTSLLQIYLDGRLEALVLEQNETTADGSQWFADITGVSTYNHYISMGALRRVGQQQSFFAGKLDDVRIYNRALDPEEVQSLFNEGNYQPPPTITIWEPAGTFSSRLGSIVVDANDRLFLGSENTGLFRSTNTGDSWTSINPGAVTYRDALPAFNPVTHTLFLSGDDSPVKMFRSSNAGDTWEQLFLPFTSYIRSYAFNSSGHVFVGTGSQGVWRSTNNGHTWEHKSSGISEPIISPLYVDRFDNLYAGTRRLWDDYNGGFVFRSTDNGESWMPILSNVGPVYALTRASNGNLFVGCDSRDFKGIYRSTDNGSIWQQMNTGLSNPRVYSILVGSNDELFVPSTESGVYRSTDFAETWEPYSSGITNTWFSNIVENSRNQMVVCSWPGYVFRTKLMALPGTVLGSVRASGVGLANVTVTLLDHNGNTLPSFPTIATDNAGQYAFANVPSPLQYQVSIVEPLGYSVDQNPKSLSVTSGASTIVDFSLTPAVIANNARGIGYWRHQLDVYLRGRGNAQETESHLRSYIQTVHRFYSIHFPIFQGLNTFDDWSGALSKPNTASMREKAKQHIAALVLNFASLKIGQYTVVTADARTAGDVLAHVSSVVNNSSSTTLELERAKDLAEQVNNKVMIAAQLVPAGGILFKGTALRWNIEEPEVFVLLQNYPNPFNPSTTIQFALPVNGSVSLKVFNLVGEVVATLVEEELPVGTHTRVWDATDLSSGVYFYRLQAGDFVQTRKLLLLR